MRTLKGTVMTDKMQRTRVVAVTRLVRHPKYLKYYKVTRRYQAHDAENAYHVGDQVTIRETRPMSRTKRWVITGKVAAPQAKRAEDAGQGTVEPGTEPANS